MVCHSPCSLARYERYVCILFAIGYLPRHLRILRSIRGSHRFDNHTILARLRRGALNFRSTQRILRQEIHLLHHIHVLPRIYIPLRLRP